jgi:hypothetical protein
LKDIVIVPTFSRPEMLWFCLERLAACPETPDLDIKVYVDAHSNVPLPDRRAELGRVQSMFPWAQFTWRVPHTYDGNTFNVMMAYKEAYASGARHVYLVEDDVMVDPDFFAWHKKAHEQGTWFCSVASRCLKDSSVWGDHQEYIVTSGYASIGVCWPRENLKAVAEHAHEHYFKNMGGYLGLVFKDGRADQFTEQDGLIERIIQRSKLRVIFPREPRAFHTGWFGYHRWNCPRPQGTLEERYRYVKNAVTNPEILRQLARDVKDVEAVRA